jgi:hypothetical protein
MNRHVLVAFAALIFAVAPVVAQSPTPAETGERPVRRSVVLPATILPDAERERQEHLRQGMLECSNHRKKPPETGYEAGFEACEQIATEFTAAAEKNMASAKKLGLDRINEVLKGTK